MIRHWIYIRVRTQSGPFVAKKTQGIRRASRAVVRVGDGRGFVVRGVWKPARKRTPNEEPSYAYFTVDGVSKRVKLKPPVLRPREVRYVITAAHCLPFFPPCCGASYLAERTYKALLGPPGEKPTVWAECEFVDPIADIAVLGPPDDQELSNQYDAYEALLETTVPVEITDAPEAGRAWLLALDGRWLSCNASHMGRGFYLSDAENIEGGMSGSDHRGRW
jgi:hypothetical protein